MSENKVLELALDLVAGQKVYADTINPDLIEAIQVVTKRGLVVKIYQSNDNYDSKGLTVEAEKKQSIPSFHTRGPIEPGRYDQT